MIKLSECHKGCFCTDCDEIKCLKRGKAESDCPRYECVYKINTKEYMDCDNCLWLKDYKSKLKGGAKNEKNKIMG